MERSTTPGRPAAGTILVTGATGFVGGPTVRSLATSGSSIRVLARRPELLGELRSSIHSVEVGDLRDVNVLRRAVMGCEVVLHVAGLTKARFANEFDEVNTDGTRRLAEAARAAEPRPRRFVLVSSLAAAGPSQLGSPRIETDPCAPVSRYGKSKLAGEVAARQVLEDSGIELVVLRPPIVYGEGDRDVLAVLQQVSRGVIPLVGGGQALTKEYSLVHVDDLVSALVAACSTPAMGGRTFFVPGPRDATFLEMLTAIEAAVGRRAYRIPVPSMVATAAAALSEAWGAISGKATLVNLDKLREAAATGWRCSGAAVARDLSYRPRIDYPEGFARQVLFARARGELGPP